MTRECDERMWNLAYSLAQSGEHRKQLQAFGYPRAPQLLRHERVRERLDGMCTEASDKDLLVPRDSPRSLDLLGIPF
jgi:hypothetical protein